MGAVRVRWGGVGKVAILAVAALLALEALPGLLRPPEPPPLGEDVGLPQIGLAPEPAPKSRFESRPMHDKGTTKPKNHKVEPVARFQTVDRRPKGTTGSAGRDVISTRPRKPTPPAPSSPAPVPYEPPPTHAPVPAPPAPGDGSEEFAPR